MIINPYHIQCIVPFVLALIVGGILVALAECPGVQLWLIERGLLDLSELEDDESEV